MLQAAVLNLLKVFFSLLLLVSTTVFAQVSSPLPWVIDEQDIFQANETRGISHVLAGAANNRDIHVRILVVDIPSENANEVINQKIITYKNNISHQVKEKTTFLTINVATRESRILLGNEIQRTDPLLQSLGRIQNEIILPSLAQGDINAALIQGAVAIATVLDTSPRAAKISLWQSIKSWLAAYSLLVPCQILFGLSLLFGGWRFVYHVLNRPSFHKEVDMDSLQETMIQNSLALRQQYGDQ